MLVLRNPIVSWCRGMDKIATCDIGSCSESLRAIWRPSLVPSATYLPGERVTSSLRSYDRMGHRQHRRALRNLSLCNNPGVSLYGHRGSCNGAGQLGLCKNGVFKRLFDRIFYFMAKKHARCAKCACAADATSEMQVQPTPATAPQMVPRRYRGRRTCRTARNRRCLYRFQLQSTKMLQTAPRSIYLRT
jgi:hypothetical protein